MSLGGNTMRRFSKIDENGKKFYCAHDFAHLESTWKKNDTVTPDIVDVDAYKKISCEQ